MKTLYGLIGKTLSHSISPAIHSLILKSINVDGYYHLFEMPEEQLQNAVKSLILLSAQGVNVTIPHKISIMKYLDQISDEAQKIGSVNTISFADGITTGYNTDYAGFGEMLHHNHIPVNNTKVLILGYGGVARAVVQYFIDNNANRISVAVRDTTKAVDIQDSVNIIDYKAASQLKNHDIIVNCTPSGMYPHVHESPVGKGTISNFNSAVDLIFNPRETLF